MPYQTIDEGTRKSIEIRHLHLLRTKREHEREAAIQSIHAAEVMANVVNSFGFDRDAFAEALYLQHRTIQQGTMRAFCAWCEKLADGGSDGRNEASVELARKITELRPYLPKV